MDQRGVLKSIAEAGYNVGFGAKKHFATFDIVEKTPGWIGFISIACGIFGLVFEELSTKVPSATLAVAGIIALYISFYRSSDYEKVGKELTQIYNELRNLYRSVESGSDLSAAISTLSDLEKRFYSISLSKQILFSGWYAHIKFFGEHQITWIDDQLHFKLWRDKIPATAKVWIFILSVTAIIFIVWISLSAFGLVTNPLNFFHGCLNQHAAVGH